MKPNKLAFAKQLRSYQTPTEKRLWECLRDRRLYGLKFRRQHVLGDKYIADFYCHALKLVVEVDGGIHFLPDIKENDQQRTTLLQEWGYRVIRFSNSEIEKKLEKVLLEIASYVH